MTTPVFVIEAPADPAYPPPNAQHLQRAIGSAHRVQVPGMGHALPSAVLAPLGRALEAHLDAVDAVDASGR
ncbi:TAP-like protein [Geodermatophilus africanus]|uniref:TAP-like protein n=1 Tax=Geodermatophilus africanus TaxID=1137993 RepID=A0A1H3NK91_9ACTN|nr:alpha/beta hydrolase [Geodermatophilus africanus]SDY89346.1 TAP-like protein [Geodermatophilus africanus]